MYLSDNQIHALQIAQDAMLYRNSGELDEEQTKAYDTISNMIYSAIKEKQKRNRQKKKIIFT